MSRRGETLRNSSETPPIGGHAFGTFSRSSQAGGQGTYGQEPSKFAAIANPASRPGARHDARRRGGLRVGLTCGAGLSAIKSRPIPRNSRRTAPQVDMV